MTDPASDWLDVVRVDEVPEGGIKGVRVRGQALALYRLDGRLYATSDVCTHEAALLSEGWVEGGEVICPLHGARFQIRDGSCSGPLGSDLRCFEVRDREGRAEVLLGSAP